MQPQFGILAPQPERLQRARKRQEQPVGGKRLLDKIVRPVPDRRDGGLDTAVTAYHQHRQVGVPFPDMAQQVHAAQAAALQPYIEQQHARLAFLQLFQCFVAVACTARFKAFVFQDAGDQLPDVLLVIDDQDVMHREVGPVPAPRRSRCAGKQSGHGRRQPRHPPDEAPRPDPQRSSGLWQVRGRRRAGPWS